MVNMMESNLLKVIRNNHAERNSKTLNTGITHLNKDIKKSGSQRMKT